MGGYPQTPATNHSVQCLRNSTEENTMICACRNMQSFYCLIIIHGNMVCFVLWVLPVCFTNGVHSVFLYNIIIMFPWFCKPVLVKIHLAKVLFDFPYQMTYYIHWDFNLKQGASLVHVHTCQKGRGDWNWCVLNITFLFQVIWQSSLITTISAQTQGSAQNNLCR